MHKKQSSLLNTRGKDFLSVHAYRASSLLLFFSSFFFGPSFHPIFAALWQNILLDWRFMRNLLGFSQMLLSNKTKKLVALYQNQDEIWLHYCSHHHRFTRPFFVFFFVQFIQNAHVSMHLVYSLHTLTLPNRAIKQQCKRLCICIRCCMVTSLYFLNEMNLTVLRLEHFINLYALLLVKRHTKFRNNYGAYEWCVCVCAL